MIIQFCSDIEGGGRKHMDKFQFSVLTGVTLYNHLIGMFLNFV